MVGQFAFVAEVGDFVIFDGKFTRGQTSQREQTETGQGSNDLIAIDKSGQGEAQFCELGIMSANAAHGDEADGFHERWSMATVSAPPSSRLPTGRANRS